MQLTLEQVITITKFIVHNWHQIEAVQRTHARQLISTGNDVSKSNVKLRAGDYLMSTRTANSSPSVQLTNAVSVYVAMLSCNTTARMRPAETFNPLYASLQDLGESHGGEVWPSPAHDAFSPNK